jgi:hypothetical protein
MATSVFVLLASGVVVAKLNGLTAVSSAHSAATVLPQGCPAPSLVSTTLKQTITRSSASVLVFGDGPSRGSRLTCSYTTGRNTTVRFELTSNVNVLAIVAAEQAGFGTDMTFSGGAGFEHEKTKPVVIPAFARGLVAWTLKGGGLLDALYGKTNLLIIAPKANVPEMEALAKNTQGVPLANLKVNKST